VFFFSLSFLFLNREIKQKFLYFTGVALFSCLSLNGFKLYIVKPFGEGVKASTILLVFSVTPVNVDQIKIKTVQ